MSRDPTHLGCAISMASRSCSSSGPFFTIDPIIITSLIPPSEISGCQVLVCPASVGLKCWKFCCEGYVYTMVCVLKTLFVTCGGGDTYKTAPIRIRGRCIINLYFPSGLSVSFFTRSINNYDILLLTIGLETRKSWLCSGVSQ